MSTTTKLTPGQIAAERWRLKQRGDHGAMIMRPELWPHAIALPLIRGRAIKDPWNANPDTDFGFVTASFPLVVVLGNMVTPNVWAISLSQSLNDGQLPDRRTISYATIADLLADGWIVD